jgi:hypothetical protein
MSDAPKPQNTVTLIVEAGEFSFDDTLEAADPTAAREAGRSIANFAGRIENASTATGSRSAAPL